MTVRLAQKDYDFLENHSRNCYPEEACALLVGQMQGDSLIFTEIAIASNVAADKTKYFEVDPAARFTLERKHRGQKTSVAGVFHSHPDGEAQPSVTDGKMVIERNLFWLIASITADGEFVLNGFKPRQDDGFDPVSLVIEEDTQNGK